MLQAAALVAERYNLFLLGPLWLAGTERVDGRLCDAVRAWLQPGSRTSALKCDDIIGRPEVIGAAAAPSAPV